jgi:hypothetical protein
VNANHQTETPGPTPAYVVAIEGILEEREQTQAREWTIIQGLNDLISQKVSPRGLS